MMKKTLTGLLSAALVLASCAERPSLVDPAGFDGEVDGREVGLYTIANGRLAMQFTNCGIFLEVFSDQPGLQVYSGQYFSGNEIGKYGGPLVRYGSLTFETQNYPDAPNKASFPDPYLRPGQVYHHHCLYRFSARRNDGVEK